MSIGGIMRTSVSGMNAQATRLGTVAENIANSDTTGYKQSQTEFSSLLLPPNSAGYNSGAVEAQVRTQISEQGGLSYTGNDNNPKKIDLAVDGNGFLAVSDGAGGTFLTRAGSFTQQADGTLVNAAGFALMGYPSTSTGVDSVLNGFAGLTEVNLRTSLLSANPTTEGILTVPLDKGYVAGAKATNTQAAAFALTGGAAGDTLTFDIAIDGTTRTVTMTVPAAPAGQTFADFDGADVRDAINGTAGLQSVASLDGTGRLRLNSNGTNTSTSSTLSLANVRTTISGTTTAATVTGLATTGTVTGVASSHPSSNTTSPTTTMDSTISTSITVYNNSGEARKLDIYYTKTNDATNTWEMAVFDAAKASTGLATSPFPYGTAGSPPLASASLTFASPAYTLSSITPVSGATATDDKFLNIDLSAIDGGVFKLDIGDTTQFSGRTQPLAASVNGNPAEVISNITIGVDGSITAKFASGTSRELFKVPLALVNSPDNMRQLAGNVFDAGIESGTVLMGFGGSGGFGSLQAGALEDSTVDLASELTTMIESQRSYTANSKVFQTGSEILDVLVNLKR